AGTERGLIRERSSRPRVEQVDRHFTRIELGQLEREVDALLERLAHTDDAAAAQLHPRVTRELRGCDAVFVRMGGADGGKELVTVLDFVFVATPAGSREPLGLLGLQQPEGAR